jgi:hypothetical protein
MDIGAQFLKYQQMGQLCIAILMIGYSRSTQAPVLQPEAELLLLQTLQQTDAPHRQPIYMCAVHPLFLVLPLFGNLT